MLMTAAVTAKSSDNMLSGMAKMQSAATQFPGSSTI